MGIDKESGWSKDGRRAAMAAHNQNKPAKSAETTDDNELALEEAASLLQSQKGYFRIGAGTDGAVWVRFKWTDGPLAGRYVFAKHGALSVAVQEVCLNALEVLSGKRAASLDRPK